MATLFSDDFNRADGAPGNNWTVDSGTWDISTNQLRCHTSGAIIRRSVPVGGDIDFEVAATTGPGQVWGDGVTWDFYVRSDASRQNCYRVRFRFGILGNAYVFFYRTLLNATRTLAQYFQFALGGGVHTLSVRCIGTTVVALIDGIVVGAISDVDIANGTSVLMACSIADQTFIDTFTIYDAQASQMYVIPSTVPPNTAGLQLTLLGVGTQWTPGTPGDPQFTSSNAGITAQTIDTVDEARLTYTSPTYAGIVTLTDPNYGRTCVLAVSSGVVLPPGGTSDPLGLYAWLTRLFQNIFTELLRNLLQGGGESTEDYYARLLALASEQPVAAVLITLFIAMDPDHLGISGGSPLLVNILASAIDTGTNLNTLTDSNANSIEDVLLAIAAIEPGGDPQAILDAIAAVSDLLTTTLAAVYTISGSNAHTLAEVLLAIAGVIDAINELSFPDLEQLTADIASILSKVDTMDGDGSTTLPAILADVGALWGGGSKSLLDVWNRADDAYYKADSANTGIGIVGLAVVALPALIEALLAVQTAALTAEMAAQTAVITGEIGAAAGAIGESLTLLELAVGNMRAVVDRIEDTVGHLSLAMDQLLAGDHNYPGPMGVTFDTPVAITANMVIDQKIDGALYDLASAPGTLGKRGIGGFTSYMQLGQAAFVSSDGYADDFQSVNWDRGILVPKKISSPAGLVLHWAPGVTGTVTPWLRSST